MKDNDKLEAICCRLIAAKEQENAATESRISIENEIIELAGRPSEGFMVADAGKYVLKIEQRIQRKIDPEKWALVADEIPEEMRPIRIVEEIKIETRGVRWLKDNEPGYYKLLCSAMEEKPAKPSVKVEVA